MKTYYLAVNNECLDKIRFLAMNSDLKKIKEIESYWVSIAGYKKNKLMILERIK